MNPTWILCFCVAICYSEAIRRQKARKDEILGHVRMQRSPDGPTHLKVEVDGQLLNVPLNVKKRSIVESSHISPLEHGLKMGQQQIEIYRDGGDAIAIKKRSIDDANNYMVDGVVKHPDGGEVNIRSLPWARSTTSGSVPHMISKRSNFGSVHPALAPNVISGSSDKPLFIRHRRGASIDAVIDLLIVVDNAIYREELYANRNDYLKAEREIAEYYRNMAFLIDKRYENIKDPGLKIRINLIGIMVATNPQQSTWAERNKFRHDNEYVVDPGEVLDAFRAWAEKESTTLTDKYGAYDHIMAFTGYDMHKRGIGGNTAGMAFIGTVCEVESGYSSSVITETGGYAHVGTAAHELGHSLGARHDGSKENAACLTDHNYIMAPSSSIAEEYMKNYFTFSPCSIRSFKQMLRKASAACASKSERQMGEDFSLVNAASIQSTETQCKEVYGDSSSLCPIPGLNDNVCLRIWCVSPEDKYSCTTQGMLTAVYGTPCGNGKICMYGECIENNNIQQIPHNEFPNNKLVSNLGNEINSNAIDERRQNNPEPPPCPRDQNDRYCRDNGNEESCSVPSIAQYCCYTCHLLMTNRVA